MKPAPRVITAQSSERPEFFPEITIQSLSSHPDLLPRFFKPKRKEKAHHTTCECDKCELGDGPQDLEF